MSDPPQSTRNTAPGALLERLLACVRNPFEIGEAQAAQLATAVSCEVQLRSWRQHNAPPPPMRCSTYRYTFTLKDSTSLVLWELRHDTEVEGQLLQEIYPDFAALREAERRVHQRMGDTLDGPLGIVSDSVIELTPEMLTELGVEVPDPRVFSEQDSPDHARRLLRRACNPDRPGEDMLRLLSSARRHDIARMARPLNGDQQRAFCSVYEHTFLLDDDRQVSLYELEHDFTLDGQLVCEVYADEAAADRAAERHALARGAGGHRGE